MKITEEFQYLKSERDKRLIKEHKERMHHMRVFGLDWQGIHQNRYRRHTVVRGSLDLAAKRIAA